MTEPKLKPGIWVKGLIRQLDIDFITAVIVRSGDPDGGAVYLKVNQFSKGCTVFSRSYGQDGVRIWASATGEGLVEEETADDYLSRQISYDPDCWIVEIEDAGGKFSLEKYNL